VGLGTEILFIVVVGALLLGPKRLHVLMTDVARAKARFDAVSRNLRSQLEAELDALHADTSTDPSPKTREGR
jgi:Sec-independent protein translocase protein TatA